MSLFDKINNSFVRITKDGSSQSINTATNGTTLVKSITIGNNNNRILIVSTGAYNLHPTVSGVTLGSQNFVKAISASHSSHAFKTELWYLINPTVGTADITVTWSGTAGRRGITGTSFYNVDQSSPIGVTNYVDVGNVQQSTVSGTITPTTAGSMVIDAMMWLNGTQASLTRTAGAIQFIGGNDRSTGQQYMLTPIIGSANTMNYTASDSARWIWVGAEIKPVSTPHQPNQRVVENFSGSALDTDRWTFRNITGTGTGAMGDSVDGGYEIKPSTGGTDQSQIDFNGIRQYSPTGCAMISVAKSIGVSPNHHVLGLINDYTLNISTAQTNSIIIDTSGASFRALSGDGSTWSSAGTVISKDNNWHNFKVEASSSNILYYADGLLRITKTTNRPTLPLQPRFVARYASSTLSIRYAEAYNT